MKLLLITDSQGRGIRSLPHLDCSFKPGGRIHHAPGLLEKCDVTKFEGVAIWLGGNDAHPRFDQRGFNPHRFRSNVEYAVDQVRRMNPHASIILVAATRRIQTEMENLSSVNAIIQSVAVSRAVRFANVYRNLENLFPSPQVYLRWDGVHLTHRGKMSVVDHIRYCLSFGSVPQNPYVPQPSPCSVSGDQDILSMFFAAPLRHGYLQFRTAEHAYQHTKCMAAHLFSRADDILFATRPLHAKYMGRSANGRLSQGERLVLLKEILLERWLQQDSFKRVLLDTFPRRILHDVQDPFWGHMNGAGHNAYGKALMELRHLMR